MTGRFEFRDTGIGFGHMQRVASDGQYSRMQLAYRAYIGHVGSCSVCAVDSEQCPTAEGLWEAYSSANGA